MVMGDFNSLLVVDMHSMKCFQECIQDFQLMDVAIKDLVFIWEDSGVREMLDRALCNSVTMPKIGYDNIY